MAVFVDDMRRPDTVGRITDIWSHLFADTHDELTAFAKRLGLNPAWIQHEGTHREHFDVTASYRAKALQRGAQPLTYPRGTAAFLDGKRRTSIDDPGQATGQGRPDPGVTDATERN